MLVTDIGNPGTGEGDCGTGKDNITLAIFSNILMGIRIISGNFFNCVKRDCSILTPSPNPLTFCTTLPKSAGHPSDLIVSIIFPTSACTLVLSSTSNLDTILEIMPGRKLGGILKYAIIFYL